MGVRLIVADTDVNISSFQFVAVYTPIDQTERVSFFRWCGPFLMDSSRLVAMGDWNAVQDSKISSCGELAGDRVIVAWLILSAISVGG